MEVLILCLSVLTLVLFPGRAAEGAMEGIRLCGCTLIPALFPFFFLTRFLGERLPVGKSQGGFMGFSSQAVPGILMSFVGGYPTGVVSAVSLYKSGRISKQEAQRLIPLCNNSGPGFFVGVLGAGVFGDPKKGLFLYLIHVCTAIMLLGIFRQEKECVRLMIHRPVEKKPFPRLFQEVLGESCDTMVRVCGLVILFSVLRQLIVPLLPVGLSAYWGFIELSSGVLSTGAEDFILWAFMMGWGGLCVHLQAMSIWQEAGLHIKGYYAKKALHGLLSGVIAAGVVYRRWEILPLVLGFCVVFMEFRKKWGSKKQHLAL